MFKPLLRTIILASILFIMLVYLGIKYHWGDALKNISEKKDAGKQIELNIPDQEQPASTDADIVADETADETANETANETADETADENEQINDPEESFQPEILKNTIATSLIDAMTKDQIALECQQLYNQSLGMLDDPSVDLLIGNCVVSNYQEPFEDNGIKTPQMIQQEEQRKLKAVYNCRYQILQSGDNELTDIQKQLLIGICVSNQLSQTSPN